MEPTTLALQDGALSNGATQPGPGGLLCEEL